MINTVFLCIAGFAFNFYIGFFWGDYSVELYTSKINIVNNLKHTLLLMCLVLISYKDLFVKDDRKILNVSCVIYLFAIMPFLLLKLNFSQKNSFQILTLFASTFTASIIAICVQFVLRYELKRGGGMCSMLLNELAAILIAFNYIVKSQTNSESLGGEFGMRDKSYSINKKSIIINFSFFVFITTILYISFIFVIDYFNSL